MSFFIGNSWEERELMSDFFGFIGTGLALNRYIVEDV